MITTVIVISIIFTAIVLVLTLVTISKGYGYKHTVDPVVKDNGDNGKDNTTIEK